MKKVRAGGREPDSVLDCFNTWDSDYPAELSCPPLGIRMGFAAYSNREGRFTRFAAPLDGVRLGPRTLNGERMELETSLAGTRLGLRFRRDGAHRVAGRWSTLTHGEWGLRFWPIVWLEWQLPGAQGEPAQWHFEAHDELVRASAGGLHACALLERCPLLVTFHDSVQALAQELDTHGYWYLDSRGTRGRVAALRCNLEEMPELSFALAVGENAESVEQAAREALAAAASAAESTAAAVPVPHTAGAALDAVRDVIGWNTVHDAVNHRRYTSLSRNWTAAKFGGFGVWLDDILYHALMAGLFDLDLALDNLRAVMSHATDAGNLPCLVTGRDAWVDRSQPPIGAFVAWMLYLRWRDRRVLETCYETLACNHEWWWRVRDGNGNGLLEYGTSPVGNGLYRGTKLAAKDESSMDNSPVHDEAVLVPSCGTLDCEDVGLNSLVALDGEMLANMARELGHAGAAARLDARAAQLKQQVSTELWDADRQVFANRLWSGDFVSSIAPTSFYPLIAGAASREQANAMLIWLAREDGFGGTCSLPSVTRADPAYQDNVYWRGRVWPPLNFLTYYGLRRYGCDEQADELARCSFALFDREWATDRVCAENYSAETGEARDQPDTDTFYGWGALMPWLAVAMVCDITPWGGFELRFDGNDLNIGPLRSPFGELVLTARGGTLGVALDGIERMRTDLRGQLRVAEMSTRAVDCEWYCAGAGETATMTLRGLAHPQAVRMSVNGAAIPCTTLEDGVHAALPGATRTLRIASGAAAAS